MNPISPKVIASTGAAGGSLGPSLLVIWILGLFHIAVPPEVATVLASELATLFGLVAGYIVPHDTPAVTAQITELRTQMAAIIARLPAPANEPVVVPTAAA